MTYVEPLDNFVDRTIANITPVAKPGNLLALRVLLTKLPNAPYFLDKQGIVDVLNKHKDAILGYLKHKSTTSHIHTFLQDMVDIKSTDANWPEIDSILEYSKHDILSEILRRLTSDEYSADDLKKLTDKLSTATNWPEVDEIKDAIYSFKQKLDEAYSASPKFARSIDRAIADFDADGPGTTDRFIKDLQQLKLSPVQIANILVDNKAKIINILTRDLADTNISATNVFRIVNDIALLHDKKIRWPELANALRKRSASILAAFDVIIQQYQLTVAIALYKNLRRTGVDIDMLKVAKNIIKPAITDTITKEIDRTGLEFKTKQLIAALADVGIKYTVSTQSKVVILHRLEELLEKHGITNTRVKIDINEVITVLPSLAADIPGIFEKCKSSIIEHMIHDIEQNTTHINASVMHSIAYLTKFGIHWEELNIIAGEIKQGFIDFNNMIGI